MAREELLDFVAAPETPPPSAVDVDSRPPLETPFLDARATRAVARLPALRHVLLHGPAGVGKHHLALALKSLVPAGEVHLREVSDESPLPTSGLVIWISRGRERPALAPHRLPNILLRGLSPWEKRFHAFHHIVPAVCRHFGLEHAPFLEEEVLDSLLCGGPRETGWHGFVDRLSRLCRRYLRQLQEGETPILDLAWVQVVLGEDALPHDPIEMSLAAGTVHAMMASSWGGDLARVEVLALPGRGRLTVTGAGPQTEMAARVARSRICALAPYLGRTLESLRELDMHVHVSGPAGPKDGVSLGWPVLAAMVSTLVQRPVDARVAFTGELSLSGAILSVGAVVEKILGAARAGALHISVPQPDAVGLRDLDTSSLGASLWFVAQDVPALRDLGLLEKS
jgi:hypothetical protein